MGENKLSGKRARMWNAVFGEEQGYWVWPRWVRVTVCVQDWEGGGLTGRKTEATCVSMTTIYSRKFLPRKMRLQTIKYFNICFGNSWKPIYLNKRSHVWAHSSVLRSTGCSPGQKVYLPNNSLLVETRSKAPALQRPPVLNRIKRPALNHVELRHQNPVGIRLWPPPPESLLGSVEGEPLPLTAVTYKTWLCLVSRTCWCFWVVTM